MTAYRLRRVTLHGNRYAYRQAGAGSGDFVIRAEHSTHPIDGEPRDGDHDHDQQRYPPSLENVHLESLSPVRLSDSSDHVRVANTDAASAQSVACSVNYRCPSLVDRPA